MGAGCEPGIGSSPPLKGSATTDSYWYSLTALHNSGHSRVARLCMHIYTVGMHKHAYNRRRTSTSDRDLAPGTLLVMRNPRGEASGWPVEGWTHPWRIRFVPRGGPVWLWTPIRRNHPTCLGPARASVGSCCTREGSRESSANTSLRPAEAKQHRNRSSFPSWSLLANIKQSARGSKSTVVGFWYFGAKHSVSRGPNPSGPFDRFGGEFRKRVVRSDGALPSRYGVGLARHRPLPQ